MNETSQYRLTYTLISRDGNVARIHLESQADQPMTVTLGKSMIVPVIREEGQYDHQQADWQMSSGSGSDWATIRCCHQVALIAWSDGQFIQRSGNLPVSIHPSPVAPFPSSVKKRTHAFNVAR